MFTKQDYLGWREHPTTRMFMEEAVEQMNDTVLDLVTFAGDSSLQDKYRRGIIEGLKWLIDWVPTVEMEDSQDGNSSARTPDSY